MNEIFEVIETKSILIEVLDIFDGNFKAVCVAVEDLSDGFTIKQIKNDLEKSNWKKYEVPLRKCSELYKNDVLKYIECSKINYDDARRTLEATANYIRLNDFILDANSAKHELANLESIIEYAKDVHSMISRIAGKEKKYKERLQQPALF